MSEAAKRGRPPALTRRRQRSLSMTDAEWGQVQAACQRFTAGRLAPGEFARLMLLAAANDPQIWGSVYNDRPMEHDEGATIAGDLDGPARSMLE